MRVPYGMTVHGQEEIDAVVEVLKTSTQMGKNVREFEERVAKLFDKKYGLMLNSGSSALYLGIEVLNIQKGSEVITPVLTFSTTVASLVKNGLIPSFEVALNSKNKKIKAFFGTTLLHHIRGLAWGIGLMLGIINIITRKK